VQEIKDPEGNIVSEKEPTVVRQVISKETSAEVCKILEAVVGDQKQGTGRNAYVAGYRIGGKTGTSENVSHEVETGEKKYIVSFIGFAPADDPQIAILILLDNPSTDTGIYISGGQMAAPVVGKMFADILPYLGVEAQYSESELQNMDKSVPSIMGLTVEQAQQTLTDAGLSYRIIGSGGTVTNQLPSASSVVAANSEIIVYADAEPSGETEKMIDLTNLTYDIARQRLSYYGLYIKTSSSVTDANSQLISAQNIDVGTEVAHGTVVEVTLVTDDSSILGKY
jgi:stage V sporulation protein D (sporulation-specific penicillin-binding protein)